MNVSGSQTSGESSLYILLYSVYTKYSCSTNAKMSGAGPIAVNSDATITVVGFFMMIAALVHV